MSNPKVSVIVPAYNAEKTISSCLKSLCGQTYKELEIIVLNDGSKDRTLEICQELAAEDARIIVVNKPNSGVSDTRNKGLELAHGKYIQFVDSDDYVLPEYTEKLVQAAERAEAELVVSPFWLIYPDGFVEKPRFWEKAISPILKRNASQTSSYGLMREGTYSQAEYAGNLIQVPFAFYYSALWNKLYRRDVIQKNHIQFPLNGYSEDLTFNALFLPNVHTAVVIEYSGYGYVQNTQSLCHSTISNVDMVFLRFRTMHDYGMAFHRMGLYRKYFLQILGSLFSENEFTLSSVVPAVPIPDALKNIHSS